MSKNLILIESEESLGEKVFALSDAGQKKLTREDWQGIAPEDRLRAMDIYNALRANKGIIDLTEKKISRKEIPKKDKGINLTLQEAQGKWDLFTEKEKELFLRACVSMQDDLREKKDKERIERLPDDIRTLVSLSQKAWNKLPENGQELILRKMNFFEKNLRKTPDVKDFSKLSKEKQKAILRSL